ncbi:hypothetical protein LTR17_012777 [Elasticomyces elasticus]|nr:hypothetical protein LTR17_012777 [Elasticomyces elasticus]
MASDNVLKLPELLENILLQLPMRDLLFAQKVCKTWKLIIDASPAIQKALFFAPGTVEDVAYISPGHLSTTACMEAFESSGRSGYLRNAKYQSARESTAKQCGYAINPLLAVYHEHAYRFLFRPEPWRSDANPSASWSRMFFTQPPGVTRATTFLGLECPDEEVERWCEFIAHPETQRGERFGKLVERCHDHAQKDNVEFRCGEWKVVEWRYKGGYVSLSNAFAKIKSNCDDES